mgnify:CR=1 FL=1
MRIAVIGLGVAGSYLLRRLGVEHEVVGFERQPYDQFKAVCAWGTSNNEMRKLMSRVEISFDEYLLHEGRSLTVDLGHEVLNIPLIGLCTYDKHRLELDLARGFKTYYGVKPSMDYLTREFDLVVDATGVARAYLPKPQLDEVIPCIEYRVDYGGAPPMDDFYIKPFPNDTGYLWYFPLEDGVGHVGAGDVMLRHVKSVEEFNMRYPGVPLAKLGRAVRFTPPEFCRPFYVGKVVGVGESIGTVYPLLGEGIIPSLHCAEIFCETLPDLQAYERRVLETFQIFSDVHRLVKLKHESKLSLWRHLPLLYRVYRYMKEREERFGILIRAEDFRKIIIN